MNKEIKEEIKKLKKEKKFDEIFNKYGKEVFLKNVSKKYKKKDMKKLAEEDRIEDIYLRYGNKEYDKYLYDAEYRERIEANGRFKALLWKMNYHFKVLLTSTLIALPTPAIALGTAADMQIYKNGKEYAVDIEKYDEKITKYAEEIKKLGLNDIQTFMKVYQDMWNSIGGFGKPQKDLYGYLELDLLDEDGEGVCRNISSDVAKKLNKINPNYNARIIACYTNEPTNYMYANIYIPPKQEKENVEENNESNENAEYSNDDEETALSYNVKKIMGNHAVTLVDIEEDGITLALDPTNPGIGLYVDGEIIMFNSFDGNEIIFDTKEYTTVGVLRGLNDTFDVVLDYVKSYVGKSKLSYSEIKEKYGLEAQNRAIEELKQMGLMEKKDNRQEDINSFKESVKVEVDYSEINKDYNVINKENLSEEIEK